MKTVSDYIWYYIGKVLCFFGQHHYHEFDETSDKIIVRLPPGMKFKARICCRCGHIDIQDIDFGNQA